MRSLTYPVFFFKGIAAVGPTLVFLWPEKLYSLLLLANGGRPIVHPGSKR